MDTKQRSDAIVVLGARIFLRPNVYNPCLTARVNQGVELYRQGYAPKILFSGGTDREDGIIEASAMKQIAISLGVSEPDILVETSSSSTYENLVNSQQILNTNNLKSMLVVTEPFHTPRVSLIANKLKLNYTISPAYSSCWNDWQYFSRFLLREPFAIIKYFFDGKL